MIWRIRNLIIGDPALLAEIGVYFNLGVQR